MYNFGNKRMVTNGLVYCIDPMNPKSYNGIGNSVLDISGNNYTSYMTGSALTYSNNRTYNFNTTSDNLLATNCNLTLGDFTCCIAFRDNGTPPYGRLVDKNYTDGFFLSRNSTTPNSWGGGILEAVSPYGIWIPLQDGIWHYLVSIRNSTTHILYGDGIQNTTSNTVSSALLSNINMGIGNWYYNSQHFKGEIGLVQLYNRALTEAEVLQNFNSIKNRYNIK